MEGRSAPGETFGDPLSVTISDPDHGFEEDRYVILGMSRSRRLLVVFILIDETESGGSVLAKRNRHEKRTYEEEDR